MYHSMGIVVMFVSLKETLEQNDEGRKSKPVGLRRLAQVFKHYHILGGEKEGSVGNTNCMYSRREGR